MADLSPLYISPTAAPTNELLTVDAFKNENKIAGDDENSRIERIIGAVTLSIERALARPVRKRTYSGYFARSPCPEDVIFLPSTPIISVDSVEAYENGAWVVVPAARYRVSRLWSDTAPPPAYATVVEPIGDDGWDEIEYDDVIDPFRVNFTAGWDPIPEMISHGAAMMAMDGFVLRSTKVETEQYAVGTEVELMKRYYRKPETIRFIRRGG